MPDWRITCSFVDKAYRGTGVAAAAHAGAVDEIARLAGETVESHPEDVEGRSVSASILSNCRRLMFENQEVQRLRRLGKNHGVVGDWSQHVELRQLTPRTSTDVARDRSRRTG
jgi:predicted GNAT family acetyltransferase